MNVELWINWKNYHAQRASNKNHKKLNSEPKVDEVNAESFIVHKFLLPYHSPINNLPQPGKAL